MSSYDASDAISSMKSKEGDHRLTALNAESGYVSDAEQRFIPENHAMMNRLRKSLKTLFQVNN